VLPNRVGCRKAWITVSSHGRTGRPGRAGSDLEASRACWVTWAYCEWWCERCERCVSCEQRGLRESGGLRDHGDDSYPGEQRSQGGHGKPRGGDGKVEQGVEGAQEHEDTLL